MSVPASNCVLSKPPRMELVLWKAARMAHVKVFERLLTLYPKIDVNWANPDVCGITILQQAAMQNSAEITKLLLAHPNIWPDKPNPARDTAFSVACYTGSFKVIELLSNDHRVQLVDYHENLKVYFLSESCIHMESPEVDDISSSYYTTKTEATRRDMISRAASQLAAVAEAINVAQTSILKKKFRRYFTTLLAILFIFVEQQLARASATNNMKRFLVIASKVPFGPQVRLCAIVVGHPEFTCNVKELEDAIGRVISRSVVVYGTDVPKRKATKK